MLNVGADENNLQVIEIAEIIRSLVPGSELKFLNDNSNLDSDCLTGYRKINQGSDTRTYMVSFEKLKRTMTAFNCLWSEEKGIRNMAASLNELPFDAKVFKHRGFYRLQHLEDLHDSKEISDDLRWTEMKKVIA